MTLDDVTLANLRDALVAGLNARVYSAAQLEVGVLDEGALERLSVGQTAWPEHAPPGHVPEAVTHTHRFDAASVTKAAATSLLAMRAIERGELTLDTPLAEALEGHSTVPAPLADVTLAQLLSHRAGLVAWRPFYESVAPTDCARLTGLARVRQAALTTPLASPPGAVERYSDLGYILTAWLLEARCGAPLEALFQREIATPVGLTRSRFVSVARGDAPLDDAVCTEVVAWRGETVRGVVHDGNTWSMGGVSGHAGLFTTASELGALARRLLEVDVHDAHPDWISRETLQRFWAPEQRLEGGHFLIGWDQPSGARSSAGQLADRALTVGHLGFTGTSLWIERARRAYVVLLTNRVHPSRDEPRIVDVRAPLHDTIWRALDRRAAASRG